MSRDALLTLVSIVAGVATSLVFFVLSIRRARRRAWHTAKARIVADLSQALGQDVVPAREAVHATIRSVCRELDLGEPHAVTYDEALEELLRHVTADPFLDADRRRRLQESLLALQRAPAESKDRDVIRFDRGTSAYGGSNEADSHPHLQDGELTDEAEDSGVSRRGTADELRGGLRVLRQITLVDWKTFVTSVLFGMAVAILIGRPETLLRSLLSIIDNLLDLLLR